MASSTRAPAKPAKIHRRGKQSTRTTKPSSSCSGSSSSEEGEQEQKKNQINYCTNQQHTNYLNQSKTKTTNTSHDPEDNSSSDSGDKQVDQVFPNVDDTNGLDPEAEFKSWKLRELKRLRRDGEVLIKLCAKEKEEIEARRLIPESERLKEDILYADQTRKSKLKGTQVLQITLWHKHHGPENSFWAWIYRACVGRRMKILREPFLAIGEGLTHKEDVARIEAPGVGVSTPYGEYSSSRCALCPLNVDARSINTCVLACLTGDKILPCSIDWPDKDAADCLPQGGLNERAFAGFPDHKLKLKAGIMVYHHKGAFYADSDIQTKHDYTAPTKGRFTKMELLPQAMQVRDFGKMSKTKWTHLSKE
ncbi:hypothetical protein PSHT_14072, partial [Puccinia striiformis]